VAVGPDGDVTGLGRAVVGPLPPHPVIVTMTTSSIPAGEFFMRPMLRGTPATPQSMLLVIEAARLGSSA
jgi:hypothetical protein